MTKAYPWFRCYGGEILSDKKLEKISRIVKTEYYTVLGLWILILSYASESPERGTLQLAKGIWLSVDDLVNPADVTLHGVTCNMLQLFQQFGMITGYPEKMRIVNWEHRQKKSDTSKHRVRRHRELKKAGEGVTDMKRFSNVTVTDDSSSISISIPVRRLKRVIPFAPIDSISLMICIGEVNCELILAIIGRETLFLTNFTVFNIPFSTSLPLKIIEPWGQERLISRASAPASSSLLA